MTTPNTAVRPRALFPRRRMGTLLAATGLIVSVLATPALAVVTCELDTATRILTIDMPGPTEVTTIGRSGTAITVDALPCTNGPTVTNTRRIDVIGDQGSQEVHIDLSAGSFGPGFGGDSGISEIEFELSLGDDTDTVVLFGSSGANTFAIGTEGARLNGDADRDVKPVGTEIEAWVVWAGAGNDLVSAGGGPTIDAPLDGDFIAYGEAGADTMIGANGTDLLFAGTGNDTISGGASLDNLYGEEGADVLRGNSGSDGLFPGAGNDRVFGGPGGDFLNSEPSADGADRWSGGDGPDMMFYSARSGNVRMDLDGNPDDGEPGEGDNLLPDVERSFSGGGNDTFIGTAGVDFVEAGGGDDVLRGGDGDDQLFGSSGADQIQGGAGGDFLAGGDNEDVLLGGDDDDSLQGDAGNDELDGGAEDDLLQEGAGTNGNDVISGGGGRDTASYQSRSLPVSVTIGDGAANDGEAGEGDEVDGDVENLIGGLGADTLVGSSASNRIQGWAGADTIDGAAGGDFLFGDAFDGMSGAAGDSITGGNGRDMMIGNNGGDTFYALDGGPDVINGGPDSDTLADHDGSIDTTSSVP